MTFLEKVSIGELKERGYVIFRKEDLEELKTAEKLVENGLAARELGDQIDPNGEDAGIQEMNRKIDRDASVVGYVSMKNFLSKEL